MITATNLVQLGDLDVTLPAAAAMFGSLVAARAWRIAFWWGMLFCCGVLLVGASKIAFMAWGGGLPALGFKSISGHATGVTAVFPPLFYLLLHGRAHALRYAGVALGLGLGGVVGVLLVALDHHAASESLAGCMLGAAVSMGWIRLARTHPASAQAFTLPGAACFALVFLAGGWLMTFAHIGYWMIKAATLLSGNARPYPLGSADTCC